MSQVPARPVLRPLPGLVSRSIPPLTLQRRCAGRLGRWERIPLASRLGQSKSQRAGDAFRAPPLRRPLGTKAARRRARSPAAPRCVPGTARSQPQRGEGAHLPPHYQLSGGLLCSNRKKWTRAICRQMQDHIRECLQVLERFEHPLTSFKCFLFLYMA